MTDLEFLDRAEQLLLAVEQSADRINDTTDADIDALEQQLDHYNDSLPPLKEFILPAGGEGAARCHLARTIVRRAERCSVALSRAESVRPQALRYLNRLSDLLFVLARVLARADGHGEVLWQHARRHG